MYFTEKFKQMLIGINRASDMYSNSCHVNIDTPFSTLHLRGEMFGYYKKGTHVIRDEKGRLQDKGLQMIKPARALKLFYPSASDFKCESFVNDIKRYVAMNGDEHGDYMDKPYIVEVKGELIGHYYHHSNYTDMTGNLGGSCLRHDSHQTARVFRIYEENPEVCSMLVLKNSENKVIGRALLWDCNGKRYMDTVYYTKDQFLQIFIDYAIANGFYYKKDQSCHYHLYDMFNGERVPTPDIVSITLKKFDESWILPYVDTVYNLIRYKGVYRIQNILNKFDKGSLVGMRQQNVDNGSSFKKDRRIIDHDEVLESYNKHFLSKIKVRPKTESKSYKEPRIKTASGMIYIGDLDELVNVRDTVIGTHGAYARRRIPKDYVFTFDNKGEKMVYYKNDEALVEIDTGLIPRKLTRKDYNGNRIDRTTAVMFIHPEENKKYWFRPTDMVDVANMNIQVPAPYTFVSINEHGDVVKLYKFGVVPEELREPTMDELWEELNNFNPSATVEPVMPVAAEPVMADDGDGHGDDDLDEDELAF